MVKFTLRPFYSEGKDPRHHLRGTVCVGPDAGLDALDATEIFDNE